MPAFFLQPPPAHDFCTAEKASLERGLFSCWQKALRFQGVRAMRIGTHRFTQRLVPNVPRAESTIRRKLPAQSRDLDRLQNQSHGPEDIQRL